MSCNILCGSFPHYLVLVWHCEWATLSVPSGFPRLAGHCSQRMRSAGPSLQDSSSFHSFWGHGTKRGGEKERETEARAFLITDCTVMRKARANKLKIRYWHIKTLAQKTKHKVHHALTVWSHNYQYILVIIDSNKQNLKSQFKKTNQTITYFPHYPENKISLLVLKVTAIKVLWTQTNLHAQCHHYLDNGFYFMTSGHHIHVQKPKAVERRRGKVT